MNGKVKFFNSEKNFGFIIGEDDDKEYFVHRTGITGEKVILDKDKKVSFEIGEGEKGLKAINVKLI